MKTIVIKEDFAFVYFTVSFYNVDDIVDTLKIYSEFLNGSVVRIGKYFVAKLERVDDEVSLEVLSREFSNYVLSKGYGVKNEF